VTGRHMSYVAKYSGTWSYI